MWVWWAAEPVGETECIVGAWVASHGRARQEVQRRANETREQSLPPFPWVNRQSWKLSSLPKRRQAPFTRGLPGACGRDA